MERIYVDTVEALRSAIDGVRERLSKGYFEPLTGIDVETGPRPGLEGYPGTVQGEDGLLIKATKKAYLEFVQATWRAAFNPAKLQALGLFLPRKTTTGSESKGVAAKDAWKLFLTRITELEATPEGRASLEAARWTEAELLAALDELQSVLNVAEEEAANAANEVHNLQVMGGKGMRTRQATLKKAIAYRDSVDEAYSHLKEAAHSSQRTVEHSRQMRLVGQLHEESDHLPLALLTHVVKVGVENRVKVDPVRPGLDPYTSTLFLVQLTFRVPANGELVSYIINTHRVPLSEVAPLLKLKGVRYVGQNVKFDWKLLMYHLGDPLAVSRNVYCTRVGSRMLYLGLRLDHDLASISNRFIHQDVSKAVRNTFVGRRYLDPTPEQMEYAYTDTEILPAIYDAQVAKAAKSGQEELVHNFGKLSWLIAYQELEGYRIDKAQWVKLAEEAARARDDLARELEAMLLTANGYLLGPGPQVTLPGTEDEPEYDPDSEAEEDVRPDAVIRISQRGEVAKLLPALLGLDLEGLSTEGKVSLDKTNRAAYDRAYREKHGGESHPFFYGYDQWAKRAKQASTYGRRFLWYIHTLTGRIHPTFTIAGTDTGRDTSVSPNLLNIPTAKEESDPDYRGAFLAPEGCYLIGADMDQEEFRIVGDVARDPVIKGMVEAGVDGHTFTALNMFHIVPAAVAEPALVQSVYRRGASEIPIEVFQVPQTWATEDIVKFASRKEVAEVVKRAPKKITRSDAKTVTFRWQFRGGPWGLAQKTGLPVQTCEEMMGRFVNVYKVSDAYLNAIADEALAHPIVTDDGRRYAYTTGYGGIRRYVELPRTPFYDEYMNGFIYTAEAKRFQRELRSRGRELCNLPCQGGNAVITCEARLQLVEQGARIGVLPWLSIYDEVIARAPKSVDPTITKALLDDALMTPLGKYMTYVPGNAEADLSKVGERWVKS